MNWQEARRRGLSPDGIRELFGLVSPPFDIKKIIADLGIDLVFVDSVGDNCSGSAVCDDGKAKIQIVLRQAIVRQRFTMAHEVGHLLLHEIPPGGIFREDMPYNDYREIEANAFAADLLVPLDVLEEIAPRATYSIPILAELFEVSQETMSIRISKLRTRQLMGIK